MSNKYNPETYWDTIAGELQIRSNNRLIAGDDDAFHIYKRNKFLTLFSSIDFTGKKVIEIGSGPGGNLLEIFKEQPALLTGVDVSAGMLHICKQHIGDRNIELVKINGRDLFFEPGYFDIAVTSTTLQHVTDDIMFPSLVENICRVTKSDVYIFERIEKKHKKETSNAGRTIKEYKDIFGKNNMELSDVRFLNVYWSKLFTGIIRKIFNSSKRKEGEPQTKAAIFLQRIILKITKPFDNLLPVKKELAMLHFKRNTV